VMNEGGFCFDEWAFDDRGSLAAGEDFAAGDVEGWGVAAGEAVQAFCGEGVDDAADTGPIDGSGAHGAGLSAGVEGGGGELGGGELAADEGAGEAFGVLRRIAFGWDGVVACGDENLAVFVDNERAEGMGTVSSCRTSQFNRLMQENQILFDCRLRSHFEFTCFPTAVSKP
jgi:hypothetical protein